jgi:uncharacterized protein (TIGR02271 family)
MQDTQDNTTVLCLFHTREHAQQALADLQHSQVPAQAILVLGNDSTASQPGGQAVAALQRFHLPESDGRLLSDGLQAGGTILVVSGPEAYTDAAEDIFGRHRAAQVDEKVIRDDTRPAAASVATEGEAVVPVVEEQLVVGKRQVQRGGVRVYSHVVETPVEQQVVLQEEHAIVDRQPVNRPVTEADLEKMRIQSVEITESQEVPVVEKSARVVEEVLVSKEASERTERVTETVRRTEVEVEKMEGAETATAQRPGRQKSS